MDFKSSRLSNSKSFTLSNPGQNSNGDSRANTSFSDVSRPQTRINSFKLQRDTSSLLDLTQTTEDHSLSSSANVVDKPLKLQMVRLRRIKLYDSHNRFPEFLICRFLDIVELGLKGSDSLLGFPSSVIAVHLTFNSKSEIDRAPLYDLSKKISVLGNRVKILGLYNLRSLDPSSWYVSSLAYAAAKTPNFETLFLKKDDFELVNERQFKSLVKNFIIVEET